LLLKREVEEEVEEGEVEEEVVEEVPILLLTKEA
jgi:hypothetical protein